jgi:hypothetical protein
LTRPCPWCLAPVPATREAAEAHVDSCAFRQDWLDRTIRDLGEANPDATEDQLVELVT